MREQLTQYVKLLFAGTPDSEDMQQEILQNTLDRYDDLIEQGKSPEAAYRLAISGIGDIQELVSSKPAVIEETPTSPAPAVKKLTAEEKKWMQAVAIGLYICCVIPVIALSGIGNGGLGVGLMFVMIAAATVLIILSSDSKDSKAASQTSGPKRKKRKVLSDVMGTISLALFFIVSFATGAWHITWLIFPIVGAVEGVINAICDLVEGKEDEN